MEELFAHVVVETLPHLPAGPWGLSTPDLIGIIKLSLLRTSNVPHL
jgi:hypothetical protein